jgi:putative FmdB family regulatory protein
MPTYEYVCEECGDRVEVFQSFSAKPLKIHEACGGALKKVFHPSGVVFKGSGYYVTDSRSKGNGEKAPSNGDSPKPKKETKEKAASTSDSGSSKSSSSSDSSSASSSASSD